MNGTKYPRTTVFVVSGQIVIDDPFIRTLNKQKCYDTYVLNKDRVEHFRQRVVDRELTPDEVVIVVINVDDINGGPIADILMPGFNWQEIRDQGQIPFARGLATREGMQEIITYFDAEAGEKIRSKKDLAVVVVDHGVAEIF